MTEQRAHTRHPVEVSAEIKMGGTLSPAITQNLSEGGAALVLEREVKENAPLEVTLFLTQDGIEDPDEAPLELRAKVMWTGEADQGGYVAGIRFEGLRATQKDLLTRFLKAIEA